MSDENRNLSPVDIAGRILVWEENGKLADDESWVQNNAPALVHAFMEMHEALEWATRQISILSQYIETPEALAKFDQCCAALKTATAATTEQRTCGEETKMADDTLVARLRADIPGREHWHDGHFIPNMREVNEQREEAADTIERLKAAIAKIRKPITVAGPSDVVTACQDLHELICDIADQALAEAKTGSSAAFSCAAKGSTLPEPQDCDWPVCGCDPYADKVIAALQERGWDR